MTADPAAAPPGGAPDPEGTRIASLDELKQRQDTLDGKLDQILGIVGGKAPSGPQGPAQPPSPAGPVSVADEIRQQLDERDRAEAQRRRDEGTEQRLTGIEQKLTGMAEKTPDPPVRRVEKIMRWR